MNNRNRAVFIDASTGEIVERELTPDEVAELAVLPELTPPSTE